MLLELLVLVLLSSPTTTAALNATICESLAFANAPVVSMGRTPMGLKSLVQGDAVCFQVTLNDMSATWVSIAISPTAKMVNDPVNNVVIYDVTRPPALLYTMRSYAKHDTLPLADQSPLVVSQSSSVNGVITLTFQRKLAAVVSSDVAIDPTGVTVLTWAYGSDTFPSKHQYCGALELTLNSANNTTGPLQTLYTGAIAAGALGTMLLLGLIATHFGRFRLVNYTTLCAPPASGTSLLAPLVQTLADLKIGEVVIVLLFFSALVGVSLYLQTPTPILNYAHFAFVSGHLALVSLMFALLPIARGPHWHFLFGISHDRILKFHHGCSRVFVVFGLLHLILNLKFTSPFSTQVYGQTQVIPLAGLIALGCFLTLVLGGYGPIRRRFYALFQLHHRVFSLIGLVALLLHSTVVRYMLLLPLIVYGLSGVLRLRAFCQTFDARVDVTFENVVTLVLPPTDKTKRWAATMNPSSFFYVQVPSVSRFEWHPFSAIVTPDGNSIGFCLKVRTKHRFVDDVYEYARTQQAMTLPIAVGGPYGKLSLDLGRYDVVLMVSGGIGVTPMLSLVNQFRHVDRKVGSKLHLFWSVREASELLCADRLMFPLPESLHHRFHVTKASDEGHVMSESSGPVMYYPGRMVLDEIVNNVAYVGKAVCVLACGAPGLVTDTQRHARQCGFDFHKEEFLF